MNPIAHAELAWLLAVPFARDRRERAVATAAGVAPDLDGLTLLTYPFDHGALYGRYHHLLTHSALAAGATLAIALAVARPGRRLATGALALAAFHLHLLCDRMGSGQEWPFAYRWPFSDAWTQPFPWGWELASWQNMAIALGASFAILALGATRGFSIVELFSRRFDDVFCRVLRRWARRAP